jgi:DNA-binding MarR family transcriptional regulator
LDYYFRAHNQIFKLNLSAAEKLVLLYLYRMHNNNDQCFPSYETIAQSCSITRRTVIRSVKTLADKKYLVKTLINRKNYYDLPSLNGDK